MLEVKINEAWGLEHDAALDRDNYNVSRTRDETNNYMNHIHTSCEFLFIEQGCADYTVAGRKYRVEPGDILIIGALDHHQRVIDDMPFQRYGLTIKPSYCKSFLPENDFARLFSTPTPEEYNKRYKKIDAEIFDALIMLLRFLKAEQQPFKPFRSHMERSLITQISTVLFRISGLKQSDAPLTAPHIRMLDVKEYIDINFNDTMDLKVLSEKFFLHPTTISKDFHKYCGLSLNKYINTVRISEAVRMLESSSDSIAAVAEKCGYDCENTFSRQFRNIMDISPSQYRKSFNKMYGCQKPVSING